MCKFDMMISLNNDFAFQAAWKPLFIALRHNRVLLWAIAMIKRVFWCRAIGVIHARACGVFLAQGCAAVCFFISFPSASRQNTCQQANPNQFHLVLFQILKKGNCNAFCGVQPHFFLVHQNGFIHISVAAWKNYPHLSTNCFQAVWSFIHKFKSILKIWFFGIFQLIHKKKPLSKSTSSFLI